MAQKPTTVRVLVILNDGTAHIGETDPNLLNPRPWDAVSRAIQHLFVNRGIALNLDDNRDKWRTKRGTLSVYNAETDSYDVAGTYEVIPSRTPLTA